MWISEILITSWDILRESAAFILVGFLVASFLHVLMSKGRWVEWLKGLGSRSVVLASAVGLPLPLCSCSVLPAAISLRKKGAGKGATLSFLISTPETSIQSVLLTYSLMGPLIAIFRPVAAMITAFITGLAENFIEKKFPSSEPDSVADMPTCCKSKNQQEDEPAKKVDWRAGLKHSFVDIFDDIIGWVIIGILVGAIIKVAIPGFLIDAVFGNPIQAMLIMLVIGVPIYVCAESSTPIAAALVAQGVSPGAALVFLLAGPATNIGSVGVLLKHLGKRTVLIYLVGIAVVSVLMGLSLDWFFSAKAMDISQRALEEPFIPAWFKTLGAYAFAALTIISMWRQKYGHKLVSAVNWLLPLKVTGKRFVIFLVIAALTVYACSGFFMIQPGQVGMAKRFGKVIHSDLPPGLHYRLPWPIDSLDRIDIRKVYRTEFDYLEPADETDVQDETEHWVLLGDENIAKITSVTHWHMTPGMTREFAYASADREVVVHNAVQAAIRRVLSNATIETVLTTDQKLYADRIHSEAQRNLDICNCGVEIMSFCFRDAHAPPDVHDAFREIASALEDKTTRKNVALTQKAQIIPEAKGRKNQMITAMKGYHYEQTGEAAGKAERFLLSLEAYRHFPELTRSRLTFEMYDNVFPGLYKCIKPGNENLYLDLRFKDLEETRSGY